MKIFVCSFIASFLLFCLFVFTKLRTRLRDEDVVVISQKASTSKTSPCPSKYNVFLSFRGETRRNFTDNLNTALKNAGLSTFRDDDELLTGEGIQTALQEAIQQSQSSVIVFSKNYASSEWCLDELVTILQCKMTSNHVVLPVFYDISPSDLKKQTAGELKKAFAKRQKNPPLEKLNQWVEALKQVTNLKGMVLEHQADRHESKFIQKIVKEIQDKLDLCVPLSVVQEKLQKALLAVNRVRDVAERKQLNNSEVKDWLDEHNETVYVAEDLLEVIQAELSRASRQKKAPESESSTSKVKELNSSSLSHDFDSASINSRGKVLEYVSLKCVLYMY